MATQRTVQVKFNETTIYETDGPKKGPVFKAGQTYEFPESFAQKWLRRGVAEEVAPRKSIAERALVGEDSPSSDAKSTVAVRPSPAQDVEPVKRGQPEPSKVLSHSDLGLGTAADKSRK